MEKHDFQSGDEFIIQIFQAFSVHQDSNYLKKINDFHSNFPKRWETQSGTLE